MQLMTVICMPELMIKYRDPTIIAMDVMTIFYDHTITVKGDFEGMGT